MRLGVTDLVAQIAMLNEAAIPTGEPVVIAGMVEGSGLPLRARAWLPVVLATMHMTWGVGFIIGSRPVPGARAGLPRPAHIASTNSAGSFLGARPARLISTTR